MLRGHVPFLTLIALGVVLTVSSTDYKTQNKIIQLREMERIKSEIMRKLQINGTQIRLGGSAQTSPSLPVGPGLSVPQVPVTQESRPPVPELQQPSQASNMISIGEPTGRKKDGCLLFPMKKYNDKDKEGTKPVRSNMWVHVRKKRTKKGKKKRGRSINISVTNGTNQLAMMRTLIRKTGWQLIELPVSYFPYRISLNDTFKLCLQCKKCNKKYKVDLYKRRKKKPKKNSKGYKGSTKPFIVFEPRSDHMRVLYANRRRRAHRSVANDNALRLSDSRAPSSTTKGHNSTSSNLGEFCRSSCCTMVPWTVKASSISPYIVEPQLLKLSYCYNNCVDISRWPSSSLKDDRLGQLMNTCSPQSYRPLTVLLSSNSTVSLHTFNDLAIQSCKCEQHLN